MRRGKGEEGEDLNEIIQLHDGLCVSPVCGASHHHHPGLHQDIQLPPGQISALRSPLSWSCNGRYLLFYLFISLFQLPGATSS